LEEELPALHASGLMNFSGCVDAVMSAMMMDAPDFYKVSLSTYTSTQWKPEVCCLYTAYCESLETNIICHLEHKCEMKVFYMQYGCYILLYYFQDQIMWAVSWWRSCYDVTCFYSVSKLQDGTAEAGV
jgi:hypothetical protein